MTAPWWRRNAVALVALAVLIPVGVWGFDQVEGGTTRLSEDRGVPVGESAQVDGWQFATPIFQAVDPGEVGAPRDSTPLVVRIRVSPGATPVICAEPSILDPLTGREWASASDLDWTRDDADASFCPSDSVAPFDLTTIVLLPSDAPEHLVVTLPASRASGEGATRLRFDVAR